MKKSLLTLLLAFSLQAICAQECEYFKAYKGWEFVGISASKPSPFSPLKQDRLQPRDYQMAFKYGMRFIPYGNCDKGNKYLVEFEARSDRWQHFIFDEGTIISAAGGIERWAGDKWYFNLLVGFSLPLTDSAGVNPWLYTALRVGHGQLHIQATHMQQLQKVSQWQNTYYFGFGVKIFNGE